MKQRQNKKITLKKSFLWSKKSAQNRRIRKICETFFPVIIIRPDELKGIGYE